ncbi:calnexin-like [Bolinopsis microptera]|uniref:calnexin-like n=1 Tax=Bolinopsis microptera TaxID=2820187 RepID=UPI0030793FF3
MFTKVVAVLLFVAVLSQEAEEEPFKLPSLKGNAFFADPFANFEGIGSIWGLSSSSKGDGSKFDGRWAIEGNSANPKDLGLVAKDKAKHHAISAKMNKKVDFTELHDSQKQFVVQYEVKYQDTMECGGSYLKLAAEVDEEFSSDTFNDKTLYSIMFGPDKCGLESRIHFIVNYKNPVTGAVEEKHAKASSDFKEIFGDNKSHLLTLVVDFDGSFEIFVDQNSVNKGSMLTDMTPAINPPSEIDDPSDSKPSDWDDKEKIPDPMATKPEDWDEDAPKFIEDEEATMPDNWLEDEVEQVPDPDAVKPEDWDDEEDGEWEAPIVENPKCEAGNCGPWTRPQKPNPEYKGSWAPPLIDNPNYSGVWSPKKIANPDYYEDKTPFASLMPITAVGIEMWTMTKDIMFDNIILTDSKSVADEWAGESWNKKALIEKLAAPGDSPMDQFLVFAGENPWIWILLAAAVILPVVLYFYCSGGSPAPADDGAEAKKTDKVTPDDEEKEDEGEEEEKEASGEQKEEEEDMPELEETEKEAEEEAAEEEEAEEEEAAEEEAAEEKEEAPVKRRTRKAD